MATQELTLESLGIDENVLIGRLVDRLAENVLTSLHYDEDGGEWRGSNPFANKLTSMVTNRLNQVVEELAGKHVLPRVSEMVESLVLQKTNQWGEKVGQPITFIEYMTQRADAFMREEVNYDGKTKGQDSYSWRKAGTRVEYLIDKHLQYNIEKAMVAAVSDANKSLIEGLKEAVNIKLGQIAVQLKTEVKSK